MTFVGPDSGIFEAWALVLIKDALKRFNQEEIPWLNVALSPERKIKIHYASGVGGPKPLFDLKLQRLTAGLKIDDRTIQLMRAPMHTAILDSILRSIREAEAKFGYMARPRNYYITESATVRTIWDPHLRVTKVAWDVQWVVMPRSWRKKLWKTRKRAA